jgi:ribonuclease G
MNEIYIDAGMHESRVAVMDENGFAEVHIERSSEERTVSNIYKGIVENVLPGIQAAFVNIGFEKNAFLYVKDAIDYKENGFGDNSSQIMINRVLKQGDEIMVQVTKESTGNKGARVTTHITLPGRYVVLMPKIDYIGISRRIEDADERERLKAMASNLKPDGMGLIVRTEAEGKHEDELKEDISFLVKLWEKIVCEAQKGKSPRLVHKDADMVYRTIRDLFNRDTVKIVINDKDAYDKARELIGVFSPSQLKVLEYYDSGSDMFGYFGLEKEIEKALSRKVWLKSGGYIVIDQTEALTSIDVNTGKYTGSSNFKDTIMDINMEAVREIARQIRIRDIGGIIIIDFIDMDDERQKMALLEELRNQLKKDRTKSSVLGITQLGLVEMTRKKVGKRLSFIMQKQCPVCEGSGRIADEKTVIMRILRKIESIFKETDVPAVLVEMSDIIEDYIHENDDSIIKQLELKYNRKIIIDGLSNIEYGDFKIKYLTDDFSKSDFENLVKEGTKVEINAARNGMLNASSKTLKIDGRIDEIIHGANGSIDKVIIDVSH